MLTRAEVHKKLRHKLHWLGWVLLLTGTARIYDNGDGLGILFRWWHPLAWVMFISFIPVCAIIGEKIVEVVPFRVDKWHRENPEKLQWLTW